MAVNIQLQAPTALSPGRYIANHLIRGKVGPRAFLAFMEKKFFASPVIQTPDCPVRNPSRYAE